MKVSHRGQITIPKSLRDKYGLQEDHVLDFSETTLISVGHRGSDGDTLRDENLSRSVSAYCSPNVLVVREDSLVGEDHRDSVLVGGLDYFPVFYRASRLDYRGDSGGGAGVDGVALGEEAVA